MSASSPSSSAAPLLARLDRIERTRRALLDEIRALPVEHRDARPIEGKWSILEIVEHLVLAEENAVKALREGGEGGHRSLKHRVLYQVVMFILRFDIPVKVPSRSMVPVGGRDLAELESRWDATQAALREGLGELDAAGVRRPLIRHPVAGPMLAGQALAMLDVHLVRHGRQIRSRMALLSAEA